MEPLPTELQRDRLPKHVAFIMDGNGRWAKQRGLPRVAGHRQGAATLKELVRCCKDWGIPTLTIYAFSTENWQRPLQEVEFLMRLFEGLLKNEMTALHREGVRLQFWGDLSQLPAALQCEMYRAYALMAHNHAVNLNVAVNYGSRAEITRACQHLAMQATLGRIKPEEITESLITESLYTSHGPEPDLLIRTSGEQRLSNYLLWQLAYTELYFTDCLWPDFDRQAFLKALCCFQQRDRRFGKVPSALSA